ncbi:MAG: sugar MFS transporter [Paludibacteraceae bacterium]|nr:sugar MFS transporter [Paludibacteraceae bacterium]
MEGNDSRKYLLSLVSLTTLFFMWGFITCLNDILIPYLKDVFALNYKESNLVVMAFFVAYFVISFLYFLVSALFKDPILKIGYKNTIVLGLMISAIACFLFFIEASSDTPTFSFFLFSLFLLGAGFTFLQIAANPLVAVLGTPETSSSRLNLSQAFNSLGTTLAPIIGGYVIFKLMAGDSVEEVAKDPSAVQIPYLFLSSVLLILAGVIFFTNIPNVMPESNNKEVSRIGALKYPHLVFGMLAIFFYVGAEVAIGSNLVNYMRGSLSIQSHMASALLSFYWGGAMIGRFVGSISMSQMNFSKKCLLMAVTAIGSLLLIFFAFSKSMHFDMAQMKEFFVSGNVHYFFFSVILNYVLFLAAKSAPSRTLGIFAFANIVLLIVMLLTDGSISLWAVLSIGLFNSIMFSNVFTLAISKLGKYTSQGSSLLVMMILGGAIMPILQGMLADAYSIHMSFVLPILCYVYLVWYGFYGYKVREVK